MPKRPGVRTFPTTKPLATMNKKNLRNWEIKIGLWPVIVVLMVVMGSMACAFYIGHFSGQKLGLEQALESSLANAVRLPISGDELDEDVSSDLVSEVYAKLDDSSLPDDDLDNAAKKADMPTLGAIHTTKEAPLPIDTKKEAVKEEALKDTQEDDSVNIQVVEDSSDFRKKEKKTESAKTLGSQLKESKKEKAKTEVAKVTIKEKAEVKVKKETPAAKTKVAAKLKAPSKVGDSVSGSYGKPPKSKANNAMADDFFIQRQIRSGWYGQVAAPKALSDANQLAHKLRNSGFPVLIERAKVRGEEYFRVLVGPEDSRNHAERLVVQLKRESYIKGDPFIKMLR